LEKFGYHITPVHYYSPIPDTRALREFDFEKKSSLLGIDMNLEEQINLIDNIFPKFRHEYITFPVKKNQKKEGEFYLDNNTFDFADAYVLYCMIRYFHPSQIIEIGSGNSTLISAKACLKNEQDGNPTKLIAIEPYPNETVSRGFSGLTTLIQERVENIGFSMFEKLGENDILFIDSSHVIRLGGDVIYEYLEILPRLRKGVIVHFHDICLPLHYPEEWVIKNHFFWNEQYLLQAFLMYNYAWDVLWSGNFMHLMYPEKLEQAFPHYDRQTHWSGSFWIRNKSDF